MSDQERDDLEEGTDEEEAAASGGEEDNKDAVQPQPDPIRDY